MTMHGKVLVPALAYRSPVNIQMVDATRAVATGDFAVGEHHVDPVVRALATNGITATAVHSHLVGESPRIYLHPLLGRRGAAGGAEGAEGR
ncbi:MAG: DUF1259 domain-containing protein [Gemmatimonadetes bacterium]|nr:DUF1259 domain-containing protein [Gemmatimonadota bacterium]